jgi:hypothetical protein
VAANHVLKFVYDVDNKFINSIVQASMRDRSYKVTVSEKLAIAAEICYADSSYELG